MHPETALAEWIEHKEIEVTVETVKNYRTVCRPFVSYLDVGDIEDVSAADVNRYRHTLSDKSQSTVHGYMAIVRMFLRYCDSQGYTEGVAEDVLLPRDPQASRDNEIDTETAQEILAYLDRFEYASGDHVVFALLWHTGIRRGALHSIDTGDVDDGAIRLEHRPETGTTLKNGSTANRWVSLSDGVAQLADDYIAHSRRDVADEHGRTPLVTTRNGRMSRKTLSTRAYAVTRPCHIGGSCPHGRDKETCPAKQDVSKAHHCPSSEGTHAVRRGSITHHLRQDVPKAVVSDRVDVSPDVLDKHYNKLTSRERMEVRRDYLDNI